MPNALCKICQAEFYVKPSHQARGWGLYCSVSCRSKGQLLGSTRTCHICGSSIYRSKAQHKHSKSGKFFCSKSCQTLWRNSEFIAEKHPNWNGGINAYRNILLRSESEKACVACGIQDLRVLAAHHLDHNRNNNNLKNLVWLCLNCHFLTHNDEKFECTVKDRLSK